MSLPISEGEGTIEEIMQAMYDKHVPLIEDAGKQGVQILCLQEIFNTPYFCPGQDNKWYASAESVPGPTTGSIRKMTVIAYINTHFGILRVKYRISEVTRLEEKLLPKPGGMRYVVLSILS